MRIGRFRNGRDAAGGNTSFDAFPALTYNSLRNKCLQIGECLHTIPMSYGAIFGTAPVAFFVSTWKRMIKRFALGSVLAVLLALAACDSPARRDEPELPPEAPRVVVVAPARNMSNSRDLDMVRVTDVIASELQSFSDVVVVPVNKVLAALYLQGIDNVESQAEALALAEAFDADVTVVTGVTEFDPYDPLRLGLFMQWYERRDDAGGGFDASAANRRGTEARPDGRQPGGIRMFQAQRVYNAASEEVLADIKQFAGAREGHRSPYDWRVYTKSQDLFVRYSCWATLRSILLERKRYRMSVEP